MEFLEAKPVFDANQPNHISFSQERPLIFQPKVHTTVCCVTVTLLLNLKQCRGTEHGASLLDGQESKGSYWCSSLFFHGPLLHQQCGSEQHRMEGVLTVKNIQILSLRLVSWKPSTTLGRGQEEFLPFFCQLGKGEGTVGKRSWWRFLSLGTTKAGSSV